MDAHQGKALETGDLIQFAVSS